jgi:quinoprotein glucose dehydrogenase
MGRIGLIVLAALMALAGAGLAWGGALLIANGGSWYYLLAGLALAATAWGLFRRIAFAFPLFGALLVGTLIWALWEAGLDGWALVPRLVAPAVLGLILLLPFVRRQGNQSRTGLIAWPVAAIVLTITAAALLSDRDKSNLPGAMAMAAIANPDGDWKHWGRTLDGNRFSPLGEITTTNVGKLQLAWTFKSDVEPFAFHSFQATPLAADGKLFVCLDRNVVVALDQETGRQVWRFDPKANLEGVFSPICRGVSWFEAPAGTRDCPKRILFGVADGRMMAVDSETGLACQSFGSGGAVDLKAGFGTMEKGEYFPSSPPTVVRGLALINGWINDGMHINEPSGGVRAFEALTGKLRWVWDSGRSEPDKALAAGETYTRGAPNAWGVYSADEALGLVYLGTGVQTPDYFGMGRSPGAQLYSTSIVALDIATGKPRWHFQTVHHDIWDLDVSGQPVLTDLTVQGQTIPALIESTKRGQFFVLDRRTGAPIFPVTERRVPQGAVPEERPSLTQPYSAAFANVADGPLTEKQMWGATPFDQLWCRIAFRKARYEGDFTPPGTRDAIFFPGAAGGSNWGSTSIDAARGLLIANSLHMPDIGHLVPRAEADRMAARMGSGGHASSFVVPQIGTPYGMIRSVFLNPLGVPCKQPPYGKLTAIDLATGKVRWSKPLGTAVAAGPLGMESHLPFTMGAPNLGGSITTAGGVIFIGATQDRMFRAIDTGNGRELWHFALPAVAAATPMTFRSAQSGRQYVVIAAGGHPALPGPISSSIMAFALPNQTGAK